MADTGENKQVENLPTKTIVDKEEVGLIEQAKKDRDAYLLANPRLAKAYQTLTKVMDYAVEYNASDIFIAPDFPAAIKIDGQIHTLSNNTFPSTFTRDLVLSTMDTRMVKKFEESGELDYALRANDDVRFRVNAYHEQGRIGMVMRKINTKIATLDDLGLPPVLKKLSLKPRGLIIVVGATGSGKSTTMAGMVDYRNRNMAGHIITIEDPIEFAHQHHKSIVTQREIGIDTDNWHTALVSAMRQAPDMVVVGEVRDEESMSHALQLAQTGHLCMCTLHATNANQGIERAINFYSDERHAQVFMDLALNLCAIVSQRLVLRKDGKGRVAALDILINTPAIQDLILKGEIDGMKQIMERSDDEGMQTFDAHLFMLYQRGLIDYEEALRNADSANDLRLKIKLFNESMQKDNGVTARQKFNLI